MKRIASDIDIRTGTEMPLTSLSKEAIYFLIGYPVQFSCSVMSDIVTSWTGLPVHHQLPESTQTHVHWVSDAIQPAHPLSSPSPTFNLSQHQGLSNESVLQIRWPKYWSFSFSISASNEYSGLISVGWTGWISLQSKGLSRVFSNTTVQKHQFFST